MPQNSSSPVSSGRRANRQWRILERYVLELLDKEYGKASAPRFLAMRPLNQPMCAEKVDTGARTYDKGRLTDSAVNQPQCWPDCLVIQCKWQTSA